MIIFILQCLKARQEGH